MRARAIALRRRAAFEHVIAGISMRFINAQPHTMDGEQSNVGERVFFSSLWEGLIGKNWRGNLERCRVSPPNGAASTTRPSN